MTFIKTIPPAKATGEAAEVYDYMAEVSGIGMVAKIVQIFSLRRKHYRNMPMICSVFMNRRQIRSNVLLLSEPVTHTEPLGK